MDEGITGGHCLARRFVNICYRHSTDFHSDRDDMVLVAAVDDIRLFDIMLDY